MPRPTQWPLRTPDSACRAATKNVPSKPPREKGAARMRGLARRIPEKRRRTAFPVRLARAESPLDKKQRDTPPATKWKSTNGWPPKIPRPEHTSQIQRVSSECVRPRDRQLLVFAKMSRGISAQEQAQKCNAHSAKQPLHLRPREPERRNADRVSHPDAPSNPKICRGTHRGPFKSEAVAASTSSTVMRSIAAE
jgi:hypothetical protein